MSPNLSIQIAFSKYEVIGQYYE